MNLTEQDRWGIEYIAHCVNKKIEVTLDDNTIYIDEWLSLHKEMRPHTWTGISGDKTEDTIHWIVSIAIYDPGGYWEPPSADVIEHSADISQSKAVKEALVLWTENIVNGAMESVDDIIEHRRGA